MMPIEYHCIQLTLIKLVTLVGGVTSIKKLSCIYRMPSLLYKLCFINIKDIPRRTM